MIPYIKGKVAPQAHVGVPEGTYEEEYARSGFFGRYAHLYRTHPPVAWTRIEGPLRPRSYRVLDMVSRSGSSGFWGRSVPLLSNADVEILWTSIERNLAPFARDADADDLFFVHEGGGTLETDFGPLAAEPGDYLLVPRGTVFRWRVTDPLKILHVRSFSEVGLPDKGMLGQHALFDPAVIRVPTPAPVPSTGEEHELQILRCGELTSVFYPFNPIDVVGWKGTLSPWALNVRDIRPVSCDRYHLPPSAHTTFVARGFVVCSFLPRPLENGDPSAMKVPFYHSNIDYDEVLFYHAGEFFSRAGVGTGTLTFHPQGIHHGPQSAAVARSRERKHTNEVAVMIDTQRPLMPSPSAESCEVADYWKSWQG